MKRKDFLRRGMASLGMMAVAPIITSCAESDDTITPDESTDDDTGTTTTGGDSGSCTTTASETEGPFPTKEPSSLERVDIRADREGIEMAVNITVLDTSNGCAALADAIVDIWHCDAEGNYSEYGGTRMQSTDYSSGYHFLRGRQISDSDGLVTFTTIYPGWYSGRATHIHVHIYNSSGNSLLVTQIAFPEDTNDTVYTTATSYYPNGTQDTSNSRDMVFSDSLDQELATVSGSIDEGFTLTHSINV